MNDTTFYQSLWECMTMSKNCEKCPLFAQGHREGYECRAMLAGEIRKRKNEALSAEEG